MDKFPRKDFWDRVGSYGDTLRAFAWLVILAIFFLSALLWLTTKWSK